jgi:hypothetical protein
MPVHVKLIAEESTSYRAIIRTLCAPAEMEWLTKLTANGSLIGTAKRGCRHETGCWTVWPLTARARNRAATVRAGDARSGATWRRRERRRFKKPLVDFLWS